MSVPAASAPLMSAEELVDVRLPNKSTELVRGRLIVREPPSTYHGRIAAKLTVIIGSFVYANKLGEVFGQDTGFKIASNPDTVRAPDLAFLSRERAASLRPHGYAAVAPELVVEIVSPGDPSGEVLAKVADWLDAGAALVWVIDPRRREAHVHRPDGSLAIVGAEGLLDGENILPGFTCELRTILD